MNKFTLPPHLFFEREIADRIREILPQESLRIRREKKDAEIIIFISASNIQEVNNLWAKKNKIINFVKSINAGNKIIIQLNNSTVRAPINLNI